MKAEGTWAFVAYAVGREGGIERAVYEWSSRLARQGRPIDVIACEAQLPALPGLRWIRVPVPAWLPWALRQFYFAFASARVLRNGSYSLVHASAVTFATVDVAVAHSLHAIGGPLQRAQLPWPRRLRLWLADLGPVMAWFSGWNFRGRARVVVGVSDGVASDLKRLYPQCQGRVLMLPLGVDTRAYRPLAANARAALRRRLGVKASTRVLLLLGKVWAYKGLHQCLEALAQMGPSYQLWVVGENVEPQGRAPFEARVRELGLQDRVRFWGHHAAVHPYLQACDALLLPSLYETFSLAALEAMACARLVFATPVAGPMQFIRHGRNGVLVDRDSMALARALHQWMPRRGALGQAARLTALEYDWSLSARQQDRMGRRLQKENAS